VLFKFWLGRHGWAESERLIERVEHIILYMHINYIMERERERAIAAVEVLGHLVRT
jgi:hypothetical protein